MATNDDRITALAQSIYIARHQQQNSVTGQDLTDFLDQTIEWVNQLIPEIQKAKDANGRIVDWNFVRTNDVTLATIADTTTISYPLPAGVKRLVINPHRDLTIRHDGTVISSFKLVNPNQVLDPKDTDIRDRATVLKGNVILSRKPNITELSGLLTADTLSVIPQLSHTDVSLLDILDSDLGIRQLFVLGVLKNQSLPDIIQGGLVPNFSQKFDAHLQSCISENNLSSTSDDVDRESFGYIGGIW